jgi:hypothetical protein
MVSCDFALVNQKGVPVARGTASNAGVHGAAQVMLSADTLQAFHRFFSYLEQDIANHLSDDGAASEGQSELARLLGNP